MVAEVRDGSSLRSVADSFGVPLSTVQHWVRRAVGQRLDRVNWEDRSRVPKKTRRTSVSIERQVLAARKRLRERSALGEYGASAIHRELEQRNTDSLPSVRTIGRILTRHGALDGRKRVRRAPPPKGWYIPEVADGHCELDSFDAIEGLAIRGGPHLTIFTGISLHGGLPAAWPKRKLGAHDVLESLQEHWREVGLPGYAQFDNDNRFTGPRQHPDAIGRVIRLCLSLRVTPVFAVPNETGFQASIESLNGRWQAKVWARFEHRSLRSLKERSKRYVTASRTRHAVRIEAAPARASFPKRWKLDLQAPLQGRIIYLRRTNDKGHVQILGHDFPVDPYWVHRLVRSVVDLDDHHIRVYALRRREPHSQPLLNELEYTFPRKLFQE